MHFRFSFLVVAFATMAMPSGSYYYQAIGQTFAETGRVTLLK